MFWWDEVKEEIIGTITGLLEPGRVIIVDQTSKENLGWYIGKSLPQYINRPVVMFSFAEEEFNRKRIGRLIVDSCEDSIIIFYNLEVLKVEEKEFLTNVLNSWDFEGSKLPENLSFIVVNSIPGIFS